MDAVQILEMIRNESVTVKAIVLTQCDAQKRSVLYSRLDEEVRMKLLTELSRIDYLPRDYIFNVANALKRKRRENPRLNTEALPGSEILVSLLERTGTGLQRDVMRNLEATSPDSARTVKGKLVSIETLRFLRDGQLLEVVLSLRHDELIQFLKAAPPNIREAIFSKSPRELVIELEEELVNCPPVNREAYLTIERKILNRMKLMANDGLINLVETNERMFSEGETGFSGSANNGAIVGTIMPGGSRREAG
jgi:flagellar motor switch protein FliG